MFPYSFDHKTIFMEMGFNIVSRLSLFLFLNLFSWLASLLKLYFRWLLVSFLPLNLFPVYFTLISILGMAIHTILFIYSDFLTSLTLYCPSFLLFTSDFSLCVYWRKVMPAVIIEILKSQWFNT